MEEVGQVVVLQKSGKSLKGSCPFHNERTPSFFVFPETQTWRCFGCNEGGDIFSFVQKHQGLEFKETLAYLAQKAGVSVEGHAGTSSEEEREASALKERLRKLNEDAQLWFHQMLLRSKEAAAAREYVQSRGISSDSVISFGLGYAPDQWDSLSHYLLSQGYNERELVIGGLARERENTESVVSRDGSVYDYFRNRIIFPIRDIRGRLIGFGGRAMGDGKPKYLNSPQTALFEKHSVLYAIDMARDAIKLAKQVVIVEGYVDAIIAHQYGTKQTVACIGSAITEKHIQQLKKLTKQVTLALDPDAAGSAATEHGIQEALKTFDRTVIPVPLSNGMSPGRKQQPRGLIRLEEQVDAEINVLQLPIGEDPDELIRRDFEAWLYAVTHPLALIDYYFAVKTADLDLKAPMGKTVAAKRLLPVIGMITGRIKRDAYMRKLATMISIDERSLYAELQRVLLNQKATGVTAVFSASTGQQTQTRKQVKAQDEPEWARDLQGEEFVTSASPKVPEERLDRSRNDKIQWEDYLIGLLLQNPELSLHVCDIINDGDFAGTDTRELYRILNSVYQRGSSPLPLSIERIVPSVLLATVARAQECVGSNSQKDGTALVKEAVQCATRLKRTRLLQLNTELKYLLHEAEETADVASCKKLRSQLFAIQRQIRTIDTVTHLQG
ncbi:MAG: DNA primase [Ktedonobacteraceae bacterium]|nr:DNA primase [Ktedonobacteraceae bacterium]